MPLDIDLAALCSIPEIGPVTVRRLIARFGSAKEALKAGMRALAEVEGISEVRATAIKSFAGRAEFEKSLEKAEREGISCVSREMPGYPAPLSDFADSPLVVYIMGEYVPDDRFAVSIVGSRKASYYGLEISDSFAYNLARMGITIISGLARGVDTAAHRGAIKARGRTIAVLGSGLDVPYPPENHKLMREISENGCVISEFPMGMQPLKENFPRRNRLMSALSLGVVVAEAAKGSGALITARHALEQGREVFAVPGSIKSPSSFGTNELIRAGARMATDAEDVVRELAPVLKGFIKKSAASPSASKAGLSKAGLDISPEEKALCDILSGEPAHIDEIARLSGRTAASALSTLTALELKGYVNQAEGKRFYLA